MTGNGHAIWLAASRSACTGACLREGLVSASGAGIACAVSLVHSSSASVSGCSSGQLAYMKLKREPGADGEGVMLKNVNYFGAKSNEGFALYKSIEHRGFAHPAGIVVARPLTGCELA
jgi:hypothetical protein